MQQNKTVGHSTLETNNQFNFNKTANYQLTNSFY